MFVFLLSEATKLMFFFFIERGRSNAKVKLRHWSRGSFNINVKEFFQKIENIGGFIGALKNWIRDKVRL